MFVFTRNNRFPFDERTKRSTRERSVFAFRLRSVGKQCTSRKFDEWRRGVYRGERLPLLLIDIDATRPNDRTS